MAQKFLALTFQIGKEIHRPSLSIPHKGNIVIKAAIYHDALAREIERGISIDINRCAEAEQEMRMGDADEFFQRA